MTRIVPIVALPLVLGGCASLQAERQQARLNQAHTICQSAGFQPSQQGYGQCVMQAYDNLTGQAQANSAAAIAVGMQLLQQSQPPAPPRPVVCKTWNTGTVCQ